MTDQPALTRRSVLRGLSLGAGGGALLSRRSWAAEAPVASTKLGKVRGYIDDGINVFKGIPYGDDTSKRRFMAALPAKPWTGIRDALTWGPQAPKPAAVPRPAADGKAPSEGAATLSAGAAECNE